MKHTYLLTATRILAWFGAIALFIVFAEYQFALPALSDFARLVKFSALAGGILLLLLQYLLGYTKHKMQIFAEQNEEFQFELDGLRSLADGLERARNLFRSEVERLKPEHALSSALKAYDSLEEFINTLASLMTKNLTDAKEMSIFRANEENIEKPLTILAHYCLSEGTELLLVFSPEGGAVISSTLLQNNLLSKKFGVRNITINTQNTEFHIAAELGFTLPDRKRTPIGKVRFVIPRRDLDTTLDKSEAKERLKAEIATVIINPIHVVEALCHHLPQNFDSSRNILEIASKLQAESKTIGVVKVGFDITGVDINEKVRVWKPLLDSASQHIAKALRTQFFQERSIKDGLTGLYNKSYMLSALHQAFAKAKKEDSNLALIMLDIDHFKQVNDTYGHPTGDVILKGIGKLISQAGRSTDTGFRYGGEEMGYILSGQNARKALALANRLRHKVEEHTFTGEKGETIKITISLGVSHFTSDLEEPKQLLSQADEALYHAKNNGRNICAVWSNKKISTKK